MAQQLVSDTQSNIVYPDSDGQPMADNTKQFRWIVVIKENLELLFAEAADVFVAGDLLWYPVEGDSGICQAPDIMVVFGRPKGDRGSYKQWEEDQIAPQVVFEILSPANRFGQMLRKLEFYRQYGVEEYYIYDPNKVELTGLLRSGEDLSLIDDLNGWSSPRLQIRFQLTPETLEIYRPDGERFLTYVELAQQRDAERQRAEAERQRAEAERQRAETALTQLQQERTLREQEQQRIAALEARLRQFGIEPNNTQP
jgi:Uma2 family endonuclease